MKLGPATKARLRRAALPAVTIGSYALAASSAPLARRLRSRLPAPIADVMVNAAIFAAVAGGLAVAERLAPFRQDWVGDDREVRTDVGFFTIVLPATAFATRAIATVVEPRLPGPSRAPLRDQPLLVRVGAALVVSEFVHYWHHRLSHEVESLWRFHESHHSEVRLSWITATRFHPGDELPLMVVQLMSLALCGFDADAVLVHNSLKGFHGMVQHGNVAGSTGPLDLLFSTAEQHRLHHASDRSSNMANYGAVLNVWDRVFGTVRIDRTSFAGRVGLGDASDHPTTVLAQLAAPFRPRGASPAVVPATATA